MKRILLILGLFPSCVWAGFNVTGGTDYSRDAGSMFYCSSLAGTPVTTQAGLSATAPALFLTNPARSQKNLVLLEVGINITAAPAAASGYILAYSTGPQTVTYSTNVVVVPALLPTVVNSTATMVGLSSGQCGGGVGNNLLYVPLAFRYLSGTTGAAAISGVVMTDFTNGQVVIPPGVTVSLQAKTAASTSANFLWREDPL
jgi:hypothetical protein